MGLSDSIRHAWDAFRGREPTLTSMSNYGSYFSENPIRPRYYMGNERSIVTAVYNRIAVDTAQLKIRHVKGDENETFMEEMNSGLNNCLKIEANLDQTAAAFIQSAVTIMLDDGKVALVPTVTTDFPKRPGSWDVNEMRAARILAYHPTSVTVDIYNPRTGQHEKREFMKETTAIVENPFFAVMNEPNSTLRRLINKLGILDDVDKQNGAGKLDLIIQLPYELKTQSRRELAENRRKDIETQLAGSKFGIAYTSGTERVTQLNRPADNTLNQQIQDLKNQFYAQLSINENIMNGKANEQELQNYYTRTIEPIISAITEEMTRKFLTKTARSQYQSVMFYRDPFKLVTLTTVASIGDTFTRNAILSSNEVRGIIGYRPVDTPEANALSNKNIKGGNLPEEGVNAPMIENVTENVEEAPNGTTEQQNDQA